MDHVTEAPDKWRCRSFSRSFGSVQWQFWKYLDNYLGWTASKWNVKNSNLKFVRSSNDINKGTQTTFFTRRHWLDCNSIEQHSSSIVAFYVFSFLSVLGIDESDTLCRELSNYIDSINDTVNICQSNYSCSLFLYSFVSLLYQ